MITGIKDRTFIVSIKRKRLINSITDRMQSTETAFSINAIYTIRLYRYYYFYYIVIIYC